MSFILFFDQIHKEDIPKVGGKGANLGEMKNAGFPVPDGFCVTADAYDHFIKKTGIFKTIKKELNGLNTNQTKELNQVAYKIQTIIKTAQIPQDLAKVIENAYQKLTGGKDQFVAVRSSATAEDLPDASFAGQQVTFLNILGAQNVVKAYQNCLASLFEPRAIFYRVEKGFDHLKVKLAVPVQLMIQSEVSGIMFTIDPVSENRDKIIIESVFGLGEAIVSGSLTPDHYEVTKTDFKIANKTVVEQSWQIIKDETGKNIHQEISGDISKQQKLPDQKIIELAQIGAKIENHYRFPQDIEWAYTGNQLYIVQSRPVTALKNLKSDADQIQKQKNLSSAGNQKPILDNKNEPVSNIPKKVLVKGASASLGTASGMVKVLKDASEIDKIGEGDVLVTEMTNPNFVPAMKRAVAIVTDTGGRTSHAAIVSRELGIPCIVGTGQASHILKEGQTVTVNGTNGEVYDGKIEAEHHIDAKEMISNGKTSSEYIEEVPITATKVYVNLAESELAEKTAQLPVDGVGLLRAEFMIAGIGEHPKAMIEAGKGEEFTTKLASRIMQIANAFNPRPVVYRATDFKTNEYHDLKGGEKFEPVEANPMIGFRGAMRYLKQGDVFDLELKALAKIQEQGLENVWLMIPFVRTVEEMKQIMSIIDKSGLKNNRNFKVWMMAEVPSSAILIEKFLELGIDGVSIGSNDLTQLVLGVDRDSENSQMAQEFDERDEAVLWCMKRIIKACKKQGVTVSICGQAPSVYPEICEFFVKNGATSVSVNPDAVVSVRKLIASVEKKIMMERGLE